MGSPERLVLAARTAAFEGGAVRSPLTTRRPGRHHAASTPKPPRLPSLGSVQYPCHRSSDLPIRSCAPPPTAERHCSLNIGPLTPRKPVAALACPNLPRERRFCLAGLKNPGSTEPDGAARPRWSLRIPRLPRTWAPDARHRVQMISSVAALQKQQDVGAEPIRDRHSATFADRTLDSSRLRRGRGCCQSRTSRGRP